MTRSQSRLLIPSAVALGTAVVASNPASAEPTGIPLVDGFGKVVETIGDGALDTAVAVGSATGDKIATGYDNLNDLLDGVITNVEVSFSQAKREGRLPTLDMGELERLYSHIGNFDLYRRPLESAVTALADGNFDNDVEALQGLRNLVTSATVHHSQDSRGVRMAAAHALAAYTRLQEHTDNWCASFGVVLQDIEGNWQTILDYQKSHQGLVNQDPSLTFSYSKVAQAMREAGYPVNAAQGAYLALNAAHGQFEPTRDAPRHRLAKPGGPVGLYGPQFFAAMKALGVNNIDGIPFSRLSDGNVANLEWLRGRDGRPLPPDGRAVYAPNRPVRVENNIGATAFYKRMIPNRGGC